MSRYEALTATLQARKEPRVTYSFEELDAIVGGLPESAKKYSAWWANKRSSQPHARFWLDAGRRAHPDFDRQQVTFDLDETVRADNELDSSENAEEGTEVLDEYVASSISLERDLEDHLVRNLESLEPGLKLIARQETTDVGRIDIVAKDSQERTVIIEVKVGEARDSAIGQIARYLGWCARRESKPPRAILIAGSFSNAIKYGAAAIPHLKLVTYQVLFTFADASLVPEMKQGRV